LKNATNNLVEKLQIPLSGLQQVNGITFRYRGWYWVLWTSTENDADTAFYRLLGRNNSSLSRNPHDKLYRISVRCIMD
jgi:hypothetical protein